MANISSEFMLYQLLAPYLRDAGTKYISQYHMPLPLMYQHKINNTFLVNIPILYPLKTPKTFGVFREYKIGASARSKLFKRDAEI